MFDKVLALVAPHSCVGCGVECTLLCNDCASSLVPAISRCYRCHKISEGFRTCPACRRKSKLFSVTAVTKYAGSGEALIRKLKFNYATAAVDAIADQMLKELPSKPNAVISYLPTATSRVRSRGFDQARLIAGSLAAGSGLPFIPFLIRQGQNRQVGANRAKRYQQAGSMFRVCNRTLLSGTTVVLVDDVVTTGASLEAAAEVLINNGARRIYGLVLCQA